MNIDINAYKVHPGYVAIINETWRLRQEAMYNRIPAFPLEAHPSDLYFNDFHALCNAKNDPPLVFGWRVSQYGTVLYRPNDEDVKVLTDTLLAQADSYWYFWNGERLIACQGAADVLESMKNWQRENGWMLTVPSASHTSLFHGRIICAKENDGLWHVWLKADKNHSASHADLNAAVGMLCIRLTERCIDLDGQGISR